MFFILFITVSNFSFSQDVDFAYKMVDTLTSPCYFGRGYTKDGMNKAAQFIAGQFTKYGLKPLAGKSFFSHSLTLSILSRVTCRYALMEKN